VSSSITIEQLMEYLEGRLEQYLFQIKNLFVQEKFLQINKSLKSQKVRNDSKIIMINNNRKERECGIERRTWRRKSCWIR
jgi:hypothetical protein